MGLVSALSSPQPPSGSARTTSMPKAASSSLRSCPTSPLVVPSDAVRQPSLVSPVGLASRGNLARSHSRVSAALEGAAALPQLVNFGSQRAGGGLKAVAADKLQGADTAAQQRAASVQLAQPRTAALLGRRQLLTSGMAGLGLLTCPCCVQPAQAGAWSYGDNSGPSAWGGTCAYGQAQSPVDVPTSVGTATSAEFGEWEFAYTDVELPQVLNTGHGTMQVNFPRGQFARLGGVELELLQFHFHAPSEHSLNGIRYAMEAHLVHRNILTGGLAVLGILLAQGGDIPNPALQTSLDSALLTPRDKISARRNINPADLLPFPTRKSTPAPAAGGSAPAGAKQEAAAPALVSKTGNNSLNGHRPFAYYSGSLTTPPCSEDVEWYVFTQPLKITDRQILEFMHFAGGRKTYAMNSRPLQYLYDRPVQLQL